MEIYIIDRFEANYAVCEAEDKTFIDIPKYKLPLESKEGDSLIQDENGIFTVDIENTKNRAERIKDKMKSLFE